MGVGGVVMKMLEAERGDTAAVDTAPGQAVYRPWVLFAYDLYVLKLSCSLAWRCPARVLLAQYDRLVSGKHLDVGVGTGYFLDRCRFPVERPEVHLLDLNENSLRHAARRLARYQPTQHLGDVLAPIELTERFDSVGLNFLLHCLPGNLRVKGRALRELAKVVTDEGVLFGSTILGRGVAHNAMARKLMAVYNRRGIFGNEEDDEATLREALEAAFERVDVRVVGCVASFEARSPRARSAAEGREAG